MVCIKAQLVATIPCATTILLICLVVPTFTQGVMQYPTPRYDGVNNCGDGGNGKGKLQSTVPGLNCGLCGNDVDKVSSENVYRPRDTEYGGKFGRGGTVDDYNDGGWFFSEVLLRESQDGFMEWRLCPNAKWEITLNQSCFNYLLSVELFSYEPTQGANEQPYVTWDIKKPTQINVNFHPKRRCPWPGCQLLINVYVKLPAGVVCNNCVIQWNNYRESDTQTFMSCSDIRVLPKSEKPTFDLLVNQESKQCLTAIDDGKLTVNKCNSESAAQSVTTFQVLKELLKHTGAIKITKAKHCLEALPPINGNVAEVVHSACEYIENGAPIFKTNQNWKLKETGDIGVFQIVADGSGQCLTLGWTGKLFLLECYSATSPYRSIQYWSIIPRTSFPDQIPPNFYQATSA